MKHRIFAAILLSLAFLSPQMASAKTADASSALWQGWGDLRLRIGQSIGGAMPTAMPAEIRSLDHFGLCPNPQFGITAQKPLGSQWGLMTGASLEWKGMDIDATVKNYHIRMVRGGEEMEGQFTGRNHTREQQLSLTVPVLATYRAGQVSLFGGLYASWVVAAKFEGYAYDGYLRRRDDGMDKGDPRGAKIALGSTPSERGDYDFADDMRRLQWGAMVGADWHVAPHWGVYATVSYGFAGIHKSSFTTLDQSLHPIYGTIGIAYNLEKNNKK